MRQYDTPNTFTWMSITNFFNGEKKKPSVGEDMEKLEPSYVEKGIFLHCRLECKLVQPLWRTGREVS